MTAEERRQYRVSPASPDQLSLAVVTTQNSHVPGHVVDLSVGGAGVFFADEADVDYEIGQTMYLCMSSIYLSEPLTAPTLVQHRAEVDGGRLYGLIFVDWIGLLSRLPPRLSVLFNQRRDCRIEPDSEQPIEVTIEGVATPCRATVWLRDLSTSGLSFQTSTVLEDPQDEVTPALKLSFSLPGSSEVLIFRASILHRQAVGDSICYGLLFDEDTTEQLPEKKQKLEEYITARMREAFGDLAS